MDNISGFFNKKKVDVKSSVETEVVFETIKKLSVLKGTGMITQEEFDAKKADLLKRL